MLSLEFTQALTYKPVVNPVEVSYWLLKVFPEKSFTPVVTLILYVVDEDKFEEGETEKVL